MQNIPQEKIRLLQGCHLAAGSYAPDDDALLLEIRTDAWTSADWLLIGLAAEQDSLVRLSCSFYENPQAKTGDPPDFFVRQKLLPGIRLKAGFPLHILTSRSASLPPQPGQYKTSVSGGRRASSA